MRKSFPISLTAALLLTLCSHSVGLCLPSDFVKINNEGIALLNENKFDRAIILFKYVLLQLPSYSMAKTNLSVALSNKALSLIHDGDIASGIALLEESVKLDPSNTVTTANLEKAKKRLSPDVVPHNTMHFVGSCENRVEAAKKTPLKAPPKEAILVIRIQKDGAVSTCKLLQSSGEKTYDSLAMEAVTLASPMREIPIPQNEYVDLQLTLNEKKNSKGSTKEIQPDALCLKFFMEGKALFVKKDYVTSRQKFEAALKLAPKHFQYLVKEHIGDTYYMQGVGALEKNPSAAADYFRQALILEPNYNLAEERLDEILKKQSVDPQSYEARRKLMDEYYGKKNYSLAMFEGNKALSVAPVERGLEINNRLKDIEVLAKSASRK